MTSTTHIEMKLLLSSTATPSLLSKELIENILMTEASEVSIGILTLCLPLHTLLTMLIINPPLLRVRKGLICICNFLKLGLSTIRVILVLIRMEFDCKFLECFLYLVL